MTKEKNPNWGGARPGAGRPSRHKHPNDLTEDQWALIVQALREYTKSDLSDNSMAMLANQTAQYLEDWQKDVRDARKVYEDAFNTLHRGKKALPQT